MSVYKPDAKSSFVPDFCAIRMVFAVVVTAELLSMLLVLGSARPISLFWPDLSRVSLYVQWVALSGAGALCAMRRLFRRLSHGWAGILAWSAIVLITAFVGEIAIFVLDQMGQSRALDPDGHKGLLWKSLGISGIVSAWLLRYLYIQHLWREKVQAESEARLQALQSRIRPHFLFNSMNTIASLTRTHPEIAGEVVQDLADLFRASLRDTSRPSNLGDELDFVRRYLNIEHQRLGERLKVEWDLLDLPEEAKMPALMLQPLAENAVYHGIEPTQEGGHIRIVGRYAHHQVKVTIFNTLPINYRGSARQGNRLALDNIRQRLAGVFLGEARLSERKTNEGYEVQLAFPYPWSDYETIDR